jgi:uncharacterized protein YvpB
LIARFWLRLLVPLACLLVTCDASAQAGQWLDVPFIRQTPEGCGAASIAMVMQYWDAQRSRSSDAAADSDAILQALYSQKGRGIYASKMESYLREHNYQTYSVRGEWNDLEQHISKGRPLIVALQPKQRSRTLHYVVVAGVDSAEQQVMFNDPAGRKLEKLDRATFEQQWKATGYWTLLALPRD